MLLIHYYLLMCMHKNCANSKWRQNYKKKLNIGGEKRYFFPVLLALMQFLMEKATCLRSIIRKICGLFAANSHKNITKSSILSWFITTNSVFG